MEWEVVPETDKDAAVLGEKIIQDAAITDVLMDFLPFADLLSWTLVSNELNRRTRDYICRRRCCLLKCTLVDIPRLADLGIALERGFLKDILCLFNGLCFLISNDDSKGVEPERTVVPPADPRNFPFITSIMTKIPRMKRVVFQMEDDKTMNYKNSRVCSLLFKILPFGEIESLCLGSKFYSHWKHWFTQVPENGFTKLKKFESECDGLAGAISEGLYESILKRCPALSELYMDVDHKNLGVFKKFNKLSAVKSVRVAEGATSTLNFGSRGMKIFEEAEFQLEIFHIGDSTNWAPEQFQCVARILQLCSKSLRKFICSHHTYQQIFNIQIPPMPWVEEVVVCLKDLPVVNNPEDENLIWKDHPHLRELFPNAVINLKLDLYKRPTNFPFRIVKD